MGGRGICVSLGMRVCPLALAMRAHAIGQDCATHTAM